MCINVNVIVPFVYARCQNIRLDRKYHGPVLTVKMTDLRFSKNTNICSIVEPSPSNQAT